MGRGPKPAKSKVEAKAPVARKSPKNDGANVRDLEQRLAEALARETATSEILRVISSSTTDLQRVMDTVAQSAAQLCGATDAQIFRVDGNKMKRVARFGALPTLEVIPLARSWVAARAIIDRQVVHVLDRAVEVETEFPEGREAQKRIGHRTALAAPLLSEDRAIGSIFIARTEVRPFSETQIALLQTFADQAVIAIENVRLFKDLEARNRDLTATGEILQIIARSPTNVQPVFDAIAESALRLCGSYDSTLLRLDGQNLSLIAHAGPIPSMTLIPVVRGTVGGRSVLEQQPVQVADVQAEVDAFPEASANARQLGFRTILCVPLIREGQTIGALQLRRTEIAAFSDNQIALLQTFADQAVIAIENVRLFNETKEALEQQTATSEILGVISRSPTDVGPVFQAIVRRAVTLCEGFSGIAVRLEAERVHLAAHFNLSLEAAELLEESYPRAPTRDYPAGRAIVDRALVHVFAKDGIAREFPAMVARAGAGSLLAVPLLREGQPIGAINITRSQAVAFTERQIALLETFADQAVIAIENVRLFAELQDKNRALTQAHGQVSESLERQTATSEILRVISQSPTDVQPVFDTIVQSAVRLCAGLFGALFRFDGELLHMVAHHNYTPEALEAAHRVYPARPSREHGSVRAIMERAVVHIPDVELDPEHQHPGLRRAIGQRSGLFVPMLREGDPIGVIMVARPEPGPFSNNQIELLKTFADQAVIAIENVRLFTELQTSNRELTTALDTQTATSEILQAIAQAQTDAQPVFDTIVQSAARLCHAFAAAVFLTAGGMLYEPANYGSSPEARAATRARYPRPVDMDTTVGMAVLTRSVVHVPDTEEPSAVAHVRQSGRIIGFRGCVTVPMLRENDAVGAIFVARREPGRFSDAEVTLLKTFADQAVIAIENVRLFKELEARNRDLTEALEQQTATSEVLKVISRSTFDLRPVLEILIENATRLCGAQQGFLFTSDGEVHHLAVEYNAPPAFKEWVLTHPSRTGDASVVGRVAREGRVIQILDAQADAAWHARNAGAPGLSGVRSLLGVPMRREGVLIGVIAMWRTAVRPYTDKERQLVETFADQAVIAIENVRLVTELQARTQDLTRSVEQLTALGEVGRAVSSTLDLETVLSTIVSRAVQLSGLDGGVVFEYDEPTEEFVQRVATETGGTLAEVRRTTRFRKGEGVLGRTAITLEPAQVPDITVPGAYESRLRDNLIASGIRAILAVPMVREDRLIGCLAVTRNHPGEFAAETIELMRTFATQSALAIQNARLFREIEEKSRQLEVASQHKSEFLANMSHELRTPLNAIIGFSEVLSEKMFGELNEKQEEYLKDIYASGNHLLSLINDILDLSKIEAGRMELELSDFHLPTALDSALTLVRERAGRRGIALHLAVDERLGQIQADERKVRQVVLNLLSNAIKFTPEGGRIEVQAVPKDGLVQVSVADTGVGIAREDQEAVFEEFRQVGTAEKKVEGTGLGLTLCRKFVELHGGKIWVKSAVGEGSTFTFTIPVRRSE